MNSTRPSARNRIRMFRLVVIVAVAIALFPGIGNSGENGRFSAFMQRFAQGWIDWQSGTIHGIGKGYFKENGDNRAMALRSAQVMAAANIMRLAAGVRLDDRRTLKQLGNGEVVLHMQAFIQIMDERTEQKRDNAGRPYYEVVREAKLNGVEGLTTQLLTRFSKTAIKGLRLPKAPLPPPKEADDAPWLILDARGLPAPDRVQPALFPEIRSADGRTLYQARTVDPAALQHRGMARYVESDEPVNRLESARMSPREQLEAIADRLLSVSSAYAGDPAGPKKKRRRYIIKKVKRTSGLAKTNLIISDKDAEALKAADNATHILKNCRVIVIVSSPIGGIEGWRRVPPADRPA